MRPISPDPFLFKGISYGSDMRPVLMGVEIWRGLTFIGVVPMEWFARQLEHRLDSVALTTALQAELAAPANRSLAAPDEAAWRPILRLPPKPLYNPVPREVRAQRRAARKCKHKRRAP